MNPDEIRKLKRIVQMEECQHSPLIRKMLEHIKEQDKQIAVLKAALVTEKASHLYYKCQGDCGRVVCSAGSHKKDARVELARKLPEIFREDKQ